MKNRKRAAGWLKRRAGRPDVKEEGAALPTPEEEAAAGNFLAARVAARPGGREALAEARARREAEVAEAVADGGLCPAEVDTDTGHYRCQVLAAVPHDEHESEGVRWRTFRGPEATEVVRELLAGAGFPVAVSSEPLTVAGVPDFADLSGAPRAQPHRSESVREFLLRTPHMPYPDWAPGRTWAVACVCGGPADAPVHDGRDLLMTAAWMARREAELEAARRAERPWNPDGPHEYAEDDEEAGMCECGAPQGSWKHREVPGQAAGPAEDAASLSVPVSPGEAPQARPEPLPDAVPVYVVALSRYGGLKPGGWLSCSDLMALDDAIHSAQALHGTVCQVIPVAPGWLPGMPGWCGRGALPAGSLRTAEAGQ